jgi:hypothetical protein
MYDSMGMLHPAARAIQKGCPAYNEMTEPL